MTNRLSTMDAFASAHALLAALRGGQISATAVIEFHLARNSSACTRSANAYRAAFRDFFRDWDVLLTPVTITPAFPHIDREPPFSSRTLQINGKSVPYSRLQVYPGLASLSGQPATAFPWRRTRNGLPVGLQAIGPYLEDRTPITFAALLERAFGGFVPPSGYDA